MKTLYINKRAYSQYITFTTIYITISGAPKYLKQMLIKFSETELDSY